MHSFTAKSFSKFFWILLVGLFAFGFSGSEAQANSVWKDMRGKAACGGVDQSGKLQAPCGYKKATFKKKATKKCPDGSFAAAGACYTCPKGYKRNLLRKITDERACRKKIKPKNTAATFLGSGKCKPGSIYDGRNGGECWKCPTGFGRTAVKVDKWNACGKIGKKAVSAKFVGRACPVKGSVRDPRNGGECWTCPEGANRTVSAVNGAKACKQDFTFKEAIYRADLKCEPGQIHDIIDGGTCWTCPQGSKRTFWHGIKTNKACNNTKMQWVMPNRQIYGLFGLGTGAEDILAKLIADRTKIDDSVKNVAEVSGQNQETALKEAWQVIDTQPENSAILSALLGQHIIEAAAKPISQQTASEKNLLNRVAQLIQWNRQFIAYQAKQAHENFIATSNADRAKRAKVSGAAVVYQGSGPTPPNYNHALVASIQASVGVAGPAGAAIMPLLSTSVKGVMLPFRRVATVVIRQGVKEVVTKSAQAAAGSMSTGGIVTAAATGPLIVATAAAVIVTMEFDKLMAMEKAEGQIRQSIAIANRPVNVGILLQQKNGPGEFLFHWASVIGAPTKPSANFKRLLAAYKAGETPNANLTAPNVPGYTRSTGTASTGTTSTEQTYDMSQGTVVTLEQKKKRKLKGVSAEQRFRRDLAGVTKELEVQSKKRSGLGVGVRLGLMPPAPIELANEAGLCLAKKDGAFLDMTLDSCDGPNTMKVLIDTRKNRLSFGEKYCLQVTRPKPGDEPAHLVVGECWRTSPPEQTLVPNRNGFIRLGRTNSCLTLVGDGPDRQIVPKRCGSDSLNQTWRVRKGL